MTEKMNVHNDTAVVREKKLRRFAELAATLTSEQLDVMLKMASGEVEKGYASSDWSGNFLNTAEATPISCI